MFDRFVVVDWSASSVPKRGRDSIWVAVRDHLGRESLTNLPTRASAEVFLVGLLEHEATSRTLLGVDFSLGYPAGTAAALGLDGVAWSAMWALLADCVRDDDRNSNNRFAVAAGLNQRISGTAAPFWGCPRTAATSSLSTTKPADSGMVTAWRAVEDLLRGEGRRPFSSWQLTGVGAVGSQSLVGIPMIARLRDRLPGRVEVWPFTTGLQTPRVSRGTVVVTEVWPSLVPVGETPDLVRDAAQVSATARWLADTDAANGLGALFAPEASAQVASAVVHEEGWVLGVGG